MVFVVFSGGLSHRVEVALPLGLAALGTSSQQLRNEGEPQSRWANLSIDFSMEK